MSDSPLNAALRHFEAAEANLIKAEKLLGNLWATSPQRESKLAICSE